MFDRELLVNSTVDLDMSAVWTAAVNAAESMMKDATETFRKCGDCVASRDIHLWCPTRLRSRQLRTAALNMMAPFRVAIAERTEQEREQAWSMARTGNLSFYDTQKNRNDEHECGRPMWQHIIAYGGKTLCPFGREYWTYARALRDAKHHHIVSLGQDTFRMVARPTPR